MSGALSRVMLLMAALGLLVAACAPDEDAEQPDEAVDDGVDTDEAGEMTASVAQVVPSLGFLGLDAARATDSFAAHDVDLDWSLIPGGDTAALAGLDAGDVDFAAVGSPTTLQSISMGEDYVIVYSLMSQMSIDLTISNEYMEDQGVTPDDPLDERLAALEGSEIGISAVGGAQDRIARWLGDYAELEPGAISTVHIGPPPALRAAVQEGRVDGYVLTAPNGPLAEADGFGQVFVRLGEEIPRLDDYHHTVLVTRQDLVDENPELVQRVVDALADGSQQLLDDTEGVAQMIQEAGFEEVDPELIAESVEGLASGVENQGFMSPESMEFVIEFTQDTGYEMPQELDADSGEGQWYTNEFVDEARQ